LYSGSGKLLSNTTSGIDCIDLSSKELSLRDLLLQLLSVSPNTSMAALENSCYTLCN
jgi:hypothetical protein